MNCDLTFFILCFSIYITTLGASSSNGPPIISKIVSTHMSQPQGSVLNLMCPIFAGSRPITFKWFRDNIEIERENHHHHVSIENKPSFSLLMIPELEPNDSGNYSCVVSNPFGIDVQWTLLQVKGIIFFCYSDIRMALVMPDF